MPASQLDKTLIDQSVKYVKQRASSLDESSAFLALCVDLITGIGIENCIDLITDGGDDCGVDSVYIDPATEEVHIFQAKYRRTLENMRSNYPSDEARKIPAFLERLFLCGSSSDARKIGNERLRAKCCDIFSIISEKPTKFSVHLCSNAESLSNQDFDLLETSIRRFNNVTIVQHGFSQIVSYLYSSRQADRIISVRAIDFPGPEFSDGDIRGVVIAVSAQEFIKSISIDKNSFELDQSIFHMNLRSWLGFQNDINDEIFRTAVSNESGYFFYMNNGITLLCKSYSYQKGQQSPPITIEAPQIVNGMQTCHAIAEALNKNLLKSSRVKLLVKIFETKSEPLFEKIAISTNNQSRIQGREFKSHHPVLRKMQAAFKTMGYFLEIKRNEFLGKQSKNIIDVMKLGQIITSYKLRKPDVARARSDEIFGINFISIFSSDIDLNEMLVLYSLFEFIETRKGFEEKDLSKEMDHHKRWRSYASMHLLCAISVIVEIIRRPLTDTDFPKHYDHAAAAIVRCMKATGRRSDYQIFRRPAFVEQLIENLKSAQPELF